jgi:transposase
MVTVRRRSRLPASLQEELVKYFVGGATARSAALLTGVNRHTATLFFRKLREVIAQRLNEETPELLGGEVEIDESYFGGRRKGKRGRGAGGKVPVFGLLKRGGKVHAVIIPDVGSKTLFPIIRARIKPDAVVYSDSFQAYDVLDVVRVPPHAHQPPRAVRRQGKPHQRHRELLEPSQAPSAPLQWHPEGAVPPLPQGMRMALQPPPRRPLARNLENLAQRNSLYPYLGQPLFLFESAATH